MSRPCHCTPAPPAAPFRPGADCPLCWAWHFRPAARAAWGGDPGACAAEPSAAARRGPPPAPPAGRFLPVPPPPPLALRRSRPRAVCTVVVGPEGERLFAASGGHFYRYAEACDADAVVLRDYAGPPGWRMGAKLGLGRVLDAGYEQVAHLDADALARPAAADLFDLCRPDEFGVADELPWHRRQPRHGLEDSFRRFRERMGFPAARAEWYGNAGVMVFGPEHRELLRPPAELWVEDAGVGRHCAEQHLWNARLQAGGARVKLLPRVANWQSWTCSDFKLAPPEAVLHWSGAGKARVHRADQIAAWAAAHPWPAHPYAVDATHVAAIRAELMTGRYRRVLEVGSHHGASTRAFLDALAAGAVAEVHLCEPAVTPELERLVANRAGVTLHRCRSVELLTRDAAFDLVFLDGDHSEATVAEELRTLVAAGVSAILAHDVSPAARERYGVVGGPALVEPALRAAGYAVTVDAAPRPGERTERGLLVARR